MMQDLSPNTCMHTTGIIEVNTTTTTNNNNDDDKSNMN